MLVYESIKIEPSFLKQSFSEIQVSKKYPKIKVLPNSIWNYTVNHFEYGDHKLVSSFRSTCWLFQIAYEWDFWSLCTVTSWQQLGFVIGNPHQYPLLYGMFFCWLANQILIIKALQVLEVIVGFFLVSKPKTKKSVVMLFSLWGPSSPSHPDHFQIQ